MNHIAKNNTLRITMALMALPALLLLACEGPEVTRKAELTEMLELPTGDSALVGETLLVTIAGLQPIDPSYRYVVWAATDASEVALGEIATSGDLAANLVTAGLNPGDCREVLVTEEEAGGALPGSPSMVVLFRGLPGSPLTFTPMALIAPASGTLEIEDHHLHCTVEGLPSLPAGLYYGVWAAIGGADAGGDGHANILTKAGGHDEEVTVLEFVGRLDLMGMLEVESEHQVQMTRELFVSLESENGAEEMSPIVLLHAKVELPESGGDHGGAHMH